MKFYRIRPSGIEYLRYLIMSDLTKLYDWKSWRGSIGVGYAMLALVFSLSLYGYSQASLAFLLFSTGAYVLMSLGLAWGRNSYFYFFVTTLLFLGFLFKYFMHQVAGMPYIEPNGHFDFSMAMENDYFKVMSLGALGVFLAKATYALRVFDRLGSFGSEVFQVRDISIRRALVVFIAIHILFIFVNEYCYLFHIGMAPRYLLPYKLSSIVYWWFNIGYLFGLVFLLSVLKRVRASIDYAAVFSMVICASVSVAIYSRAVMLFSALPLLAALWILYSERITKWVVVRHLIIYVAVFAVVIVLTSYLRVANYYADTQVDGFKIYLGETMSIFFNRWVGVEGLQAVVSYPEKSVFLFLDNIINDLCKVGRDIFQEICASPFFGTKYESVRVSIPGLFAFLYISGSALVVFFGAFIASLFLMCYEAVVYRLTGNGFLLIAIACGFANGFSQYSSTRISLIYCLELFVTIFMYRGLIVFLGRK